MMNVNLHAKLRSFPEVCKQLANINESYFRAASTIKLEIIWNIQIIFVPLHHTSCFSGNNYSHCNIYQIMKHTIQQKNMEQENVMNEQNHEIDFSTVPDWYVLCTLQNCPLCNQCLRHLAASQAPATLQTAVCVMPKVLNDTQCRFFDPVRKVTVARGFTHLFDKVLKNDFTAMRESLTYYLHGSKLFYEYKRGDRPLMPEQQEWIRQLVKKFGYDWDVPFDRFEEAIDFKYIK